MTHPPQSFCEHMHMHMHMHIHMHMREESARVSASHSPSWDAVLPSDWHRSLSLLDCVLAWSRGWVLA